MEVVEEVLGIALCRARTIVLVTFDNIVAKMAARSAYVRPSPRDPGVPITCG